MLFEVGVDSGAHGSMEARGTEGLEQLEALQLVLHRILHLGETQFDAVRRSSAPARRACPPRYVDAGDRLGGYDKPRTGVGDCATASSTCSWNCSALAKNNGASQRKSTKPRDAPGIGVAGDIVVALHAFSPSQHGVDAAASRPRRTPSRAMTMANRMPGMGPKMATPTKQAIGKPELPTLDAVDAAQVGESRTSRWPRRSPRLPGQYWADFAAGWAQRPVADATATAPITPVSWVLDPAASATGVRDELLLIEKPWKQSGGQVGGAQTDHLLVRIDLRAASGPHRCVTGRWYRRTTPWRRRSRRSPLGLGRRR